MSGARALISREEAAELCGVCVETFRTETEEFKDLDLETGSTRNGRPPPWVHEGADALLTLAATRRSRLQIGGAS